MVSHQIHDYGPKVQSFKGEFNLMRHRQFQNHHWHRKTEMFSGKFGNSQGDCPGFEIPAACVWESLTM